MSASAAKPAPGPAVRSPARWLADDLLGGVGAGLFVVYCGWWALWLARGRLPPALFLALTSLPAPTTGCTRSLLCLLQGNWRQSLCWHPLSVPILGLFLVSLGRLAWQGLRGRRLRLPAGLLYVWAALLLAAWAAKILIGPSYW